MKALSCDPAQIKGMSERLIISHYENNYGGAVKRLNSIEEKLAELDYVDAAGFLINGLKREQLIAMNSMILHELFFDGLGAESEPGPILRDALARDFGSYERWRSEFIAMARRWLVTVSSSINGRRTIAILSLGARRFSRSTCTSTPITSISAQRQHTSTPLWRPSAGKIPISCSPKFRKGAGRNRATSSEEVWYAWSSSTLVRWCNHIGIRRGSRSRLAEG
jgi:hypothetical protein